MPYFNRTSGATAAALLLLSVLAGCGGQTATDTSQSGQPGPLAPGQPSPALPIEGWVDGLAPDAAELAGKVGVVEVWAHW